MTSALALDVETPAFVIDEAALRRNVEEFQGALAGRWPNSCVSYSVKTNCLPWVLGFMKRAGVGAEVVSAEEYEMALLCGFHAPDVVYNGPIKEPRSVAAALAAGATVNCDSESDLEVVCSVAPPSEQVGVRVNFDPSRFEAGDVGYVEDGPRFGFSEATGDLGRAIGSLLRACGPWIGLHLHCNSVTRSPAVYAAIASYASDLVGRYGLEPAFVDVGGGFFGGVPGKPGPEEYVRVLAEGLSVAVDPRVTRLVVEPGSALVGSAVELVSTVLDAKDTGRARIVTTDASRLHVDPLWKKSRYELEVARGRGARPSVGRQVVCGYTCMDHDRLTVLEGEPRVDRGDRICFKKVGAYSMTLGGPFIRAWPDVYVLARDGHLERIRDRLGVGDYVATQVSGRR